MPTKYKRGGRLLMTRWGRRDSAGGKIESSSSRQYSYVDFRTVENNIPDWKSRISRLQSATTSLDGERYTMKAKPGYYDYSFYNGLEKKTYTYWHRGMMGYYPDFPTASTLSATKADNAAKARFVKRAQEVQRSIQGSVALGELGETLRMIRNPAKSFREGLDDYMRSVKKRATSRRQPGSRMPSANQLRRMIADTWLEYAFGWSPLINDVRSGAEALARRRHELRRETVKVVGGGSEFTVTVKPPNQCVYQYVVSYYYPRTMYEVNVRYYGVLKREVYNDYQWDMELFGFTLEDFIPTVWELIPYSFLVDYFTNIGEIINSYSFNTAKLAWTNRAERKLAVLSAKSWFDENYSRNEISKNPSYEWLGDNRSDPYIELKHVIVKRSKYLGSFVPTIEFQIPGMGTKWINLSALALGHADARRAVSRRG